MSSPAHDVVTPLRPKPARVRAALFDTFPELSARFLADRFLVPWSKIPGLQADEGPLETLTVENQRAVARVFGQGPLVVLSHGWAGSGPQLLELGRAIAERGFRVAVFDAPAHGSAPGRTTHAREFARCIELISERHGPAFSLVGHSLGGLACALAAERVRPRGLVLIAPMPSLDFALTGFQSAVGFGDALKARILDRVVRRAQVSPEQSRVEPALGAAQGTLFIHDRKDRRIPVDVSRELARRTAGSEYVETEGLGHGRVLAEPSIHEHIADFLLRLSRRSDAPNADSGRAATQQASGSLSP